MSKNHAMVIDFNVHKKSNHFDVVAIEYRTQFVNTDTVCIHWHAVYTDQLCTLTVCVLLLFCTLTQMVNTNTVGV